MQHLKRCIQEFIRLTGFWVIAKKPLAVQRYLLCQLIEVQQTLLLQLAGQSNKSQPQRGDLPIPLGVRPRRKVSIQSADSQGTC